VKPSKEALEVAHEWLVSHRIKASDCSYSLARDWIFVTLPVGKVETLLKTEYSTYIDDEGMMIYRTTEYSLPKALHAHVSTIQPTTSFSRMKRANRQARRNPNPDPFAELQQRSLS
jgi:tripeptidyl-peptidase-1